MYQGALNHKPLQAVNYQESLLDLLSMKSVKMSDVAKSEAHVDVVVSKVQKRRAFIPAALKGGKWVLVLYFITLMLSGSDLYIIYANHGYRYCQG